MAELHWGCLVVLIDPLGRLSNRFGVFTDKIEAEAFLVRYKKARPLAGDWQYHIVQLWEAYAILERFEFLEALDESVQ